MKTDKTKIDLDEFEARMALIEAAEPAGNQRVHVQTWKLRAMIRAIRAAIAERDEGDMSPFGMSKLAELRDALRPFRKDDGA